MSGYHLLSLIDTKCVPCVYFQNCKIKDHYQEVSKNSKIDSKESEKLTNCLFFRKII